MKPPPQSRAMVVASASPQWSTASPKPTPRVRWWWLAGAAAFGAYASIQISPKLEPLALLHTSRDYAGVINRLSKDDPATPGQDGSDQSAGEPLSDRALFADWLLNPTPPSSFTVDGAIRVERALVLQQRAEIEAQERQRLAAAEAHAAMVEAERRKEAEQLRADNQAFYAQRAAAGAQSAATAAAQAKTVACNTARARAYGTAASVPAFLAWVRAHPCPEGTDIGDGYWNVAR